jgi:hypothetical protein
LRNGALVTFAEIFAFAARLALTDAYSSSPSVHIEVTLNDLRDRYLYVDDPRKTGLYRTHKAAIESFPYVVDITRTDLIAEPRKYALEGAIHLFNRFGWRPGVANLRSVLDELG